ncbi:MAG: cell division protein [Cytophagales bacterium CG12_big_fil_rev_8_21_14_0_65_40_12]|nr:MAG: cell division protein [Cytophagales bacterium CG12_big_fil_rev_8_21_14_0_65_40_12]PIW04621.1 MAG: cell division protein [Cytophagales bacterium CG17_big_fil_post_rev_8_21_14_2_50_40_13]
MSVNKPEKKVRKKKKVGAYQYGTVIFSVALALFVVGLFGILLLHTNKLTSNIQENIELQVYLKKNISENQRSRIQLDISTSAYVLKKEEKPQIKFISKEEAAKKFIEDTGEDFSEFLGDNPLRDALVVNIAPEFQTNLKLDSLSKSIEQISGVFEVTYVESLVDSINKNLKNLSLLLLGFAAILLIIVTMLINSTIKLALFSQRFLIRSMQLVGATSGFIKRPFLQRSMFHGAIAGIVASLLLYGLLQFANSKIDRLVELQEETYLLALYGLLIVLGSFIAFISTYRAMNKYLKMSLDELY